MLGKIKTSLLLVLLQLASTVGTLAYGQKITINTADLVLVKGSDYEENTPNKAPYVGGIVSMYLCDSKLGISGSDIETSFKRAFLESRHFSYSLYIIHAMDEDTYKAQALTPQSFAALDIVDSSGDEWTTDVFEFQNGLRKDEMVYVRLIQIKEYSGQQSLPENRAERIKLYARKIRSSNDFASDYGFPTPVVIGGSIKQPGIKMSECNFNDGKDNYSAYFRTGPSLFTSGVPAIEELVYDQTPDPTTGDFSRYYNNFDNTILNFYSSKDLYSMTVIFSQGCSSNVSYPMEFEVLGIGYSGGGTTPILDKVSPPTLVLVCDQASSAVNTAFSGDGYLNDDPSFGYKLAPRQSYIKSQILPSSPNLVSIHSSLKNAKDHGSKAPPSTDPAIQLHVPRGGNGSVYYNITYGSGATQCTTTGRLEIGQQIPSKMPSTSLASCIQGLSSTGEPTGVFSFEALKTDFTNISVDGKAIPTSGGYTSTAGKVKVTATWDQIRH